MDSGRRSSTGDAKPTPPTPRRGQVWLARLDKERPALIVHRDFAGRVLNAVLVAPVTTTVRGIPTEVPLGAADGMDRECAVSLDNLTLLPRDRLVRPLARLSAARMSDVCRALGV